MRPSIAALGGLLLAIGSLEAQEPLAPPATGGVVMLDALLQRLAETRRVLVIGAHPDDEDTALLTLMARGRGVDAAYLSLSRGEGGQNLLGSELGVALGLLRSRELGAARVIDGARQFFTRAYDFGYTRSLAETEGFWTPDSILKDVVRVIRRFRPHVVVPVFSGERRDGHGQHQFSGVVARQAFAAAGDSTRYPELLTQEELTPWTPLKLYRSTRFDSTATTVVLPTGGLDPRSGKTYNQIARASRSQHRSQDFGVLQPTGPAHSRLALLATRVAGAGDDLLDGIARDSSWLATLADSLRRELSAARISDAVTPLTAALRRARSSGVAEERICLLERAIAIAAGIVVDATASTAILVPRDTFNVRIDVYNGGLTRVQLTGVATRPSWINQPAIADGGSSSDPTPGATTPLAPGTMHTVRSSVRVPADAPLTQPYFLGRPPVGALYDWSGASAEERGLPFGPPPVQVSVTALVDGTLVRIAREVSYRYADQAIGEVRTPLRIVPLIDVTLEPEELVWSTDGPQTQTLIATLVDNGDDPIDGTVELTLDGWPAPDPHPFRLERAGESRVFSFTIVRPPGLVRGSVHARAVARANDGGVFDRGVMEIAYPHIRPVAWVRPAQAEIRVAPIALPPVGVIGYVRGAADRVPEALERIGLSVHVLAGDELARTDLSTFDAIVVGSRAYETDSALGRHNDRLLAYVRGGGLLLVQYQQYQLVRGGYLPYPFEIAFPHDRITDEHAPVRILEPRHAAFVSPNLIGPEDWEGWPQERGLYFPREWDDRYQPLLEMADPGGPALRGGLLVARYGEGTYIYTGLSFFRALPAGVPGAYRLFANLLGLGVNDVQ